MTEPANRPISRSIRRLLYGALIAGGVAAPLTACFELEYRSVHFHAARPDFLRMPQPWIGSPSEKRALGPTNWTDPDEKLRQLERTARAAERQGEFSRAARIWTQWQERHRQAAHSASGSYDSPPSPQEAKPSLPDRIAALHAWDGPEHTLGLRTYLQARDHADAGQYAEAARILTRLKAEPFRTQAEYLRAALLFHAGQLEAAERTYQKLVQRRPDHPTAHYMLGRIPYRQVLATAEEGDLPAPALPTQRPLLRRAAEAYDTCSRLQPKGHLGLDAAGMAGACYFRLGDYPQALLRYCRQIAALSAGEERLPAWTSARWCLRRMTLADHEAFQKLALREPEAAAIYLDLNLYYGRAGTRGLHRFGQYALQLLDREPQAGLSARLLNHLSVIEDRAGRHANAHRLATRAVERSSAGGARDQARWQLALALSHLKRDREALEQYERLTREAALPKMRRGAREAAAVLSERLQDYPNAIRHYLDLEYRPDYGYLVDCLATPEDLRTFLRRYPRHPRTRLIRYSLGLRLLRTGNYSEAEKVLASLGAWLATAEQAYPRTSSRGKAVPPPLETARYLGQCARKEATAKTDAVRAHWAYEAARYVFHGRHLLFYNSILWKGERSLAFDIQGGPHNVEQPGKELPASEQRKLRRYHEEHAALFQALWRFERIVRNYPKTPQAPQSLYSAALCHTFLATLDTYWGHRRKENHTGKAIQFYRHLQREYPESPLAPAARRFGGPPVEAKQEAK